MTSFPRYTLLGLCTLGILFGSFGSVLLTRLSGSFSRKILKSIAFGRSQCPHCKHILSASELIPLASFFIQKGECKHCKHPLSLFYPTLEIISGLIFLLIPLGFLRAGYSLSFGELAFWITISWLLGLLLVYDLFTTTLAEGVWWIALLISLSVQFFGGALGTSNYSAAFFSSLLFGGFFLLLYHGAKWYVRMKYHRQEEGLGFGDVYLAFLLGNLFGGVYVLQGLDFSWLSCIQFLLLFLLLSSILGIAIHVIGRRFFAQMHITFAPSIPFFPAMILAFWILLFCGSYLISLIY